MKFARESSVWLVFLVVMSYALREVPELARVAEDVSNDGEIVACFEASTVITRIHREESPRFQPRSSPVVTNFETLPASGLAAPRAWGGQDLLRILVIRRI